jgi:hypothetical protein
LLHALTGFKEKEKPENALFSGFLASPARFERAAFRLGAQEDSLKKARVLGKNPQCVDFSHSIYGNAGTRE